MRPPATDLEEHRHVVVTGRVLRSSGAGYGEIGIPGVAVSDGFTIIQTDKDGYYRLPIDTGRRNTNLAYITVPRGWRAPCDRSMRPAFARRIDFRNLENVDFVLQPDPLSEDDEYCFIALTDVHVQHGTTNTKERFRRQIEYINALTNEFGVGAGCGRFTTIAGDLTNHATSAEFRDYLTATAASLLPVWPAAGNHDLLQPKSRGPHPTGHRTSSTGPSYKDAIDGYRQAVGPEWYSFEYGPHHFVVLENYRGFEEHDQLAWLRQDLGIHATNKPVVVITHVPWNVPQTPSREKIDPYLDLLAQYHVCLLLAGHIHSNDVTTGLVGRALHTVTTSTSFSLDHTPAGFRVVEFREGRVHASFCEFDADRGATVVHPVGDIATSDEPTPVHINRYRLPGVITEAEYRVPPSPWRPLHPVGSRTWADCDATRPDTGRVHELRVRVRDRPGAGWTESTAWFQIVAGKETVPPQQGSPWAMFHRDTRHSGLSPDTVAPPLNLAWVTHTGGTILSSSPAVADGLIFIGVRNEDRAEGNGVTALELGTGRRRWRTTTPGPVEGSVAVVDDVVLAPSARGPLQALDVASGSVLWEWMPHDPGAAPCWMYFSPTIADGTVYQAYSVADGSWVAALDAKSGDLQWHTRHPIGRNWISHASPAVDSDLLVFSTAHANLVALDATDGSMRWQTALGGGLGVRAKPVLADGLVLLARHGDHLVAVEADGGTERWRYAVDGVSLLPGTDTAATPAVADGLVYAGFCDGSVAAFHLGSGEIVWRTRTEDAVMSSPAISGEVLYIGSNDGRLRALDRASGDPLWAFDVGSWMASSPAVTGNAVVAAAWDGNIYAFTGEERN